MQFDDSKSFEMVNRYLSEVNSLLEKSYKEGNDKMEGLITRLEHFIAFTFPHGKERLANFRRSMPFRISVGNRKETEEEKQKWYIQRLKAVKDNLIAYKEELQSIPLEKETKSTTKTEVKNFDEKKLANKLYYDIITHPLIRQASEEHFKNEAYRNAVLDAMIRLEEMIKEKASFPRDNKGKELSGVALMHKVFDPDKPILNWCKGARQIERDELEGYKHIFAGAMLGIRDPKAHAIFRINPMRALKLLTLAVLLAELVDASRFINQAK